MTWPGLKIRGGLPRQCLLRTPETDRDSEGSGGLRSRLHILTLGDTVIRKAKHSAP